MNKFFREIYNSRSLQLYGAALAFTHILTAFYWRAYPAFTEPAICWPIFPHCEGLAFLYRHSSLTLSLYLAVGLGAFCGFVFRRIGLGVGLLSIALLFKCLLVLTDYRMMGNYHYTAMLLQLAFLALPEKKQALRFLVVLLYLSAGSVKFNSDWLSGQALPQLPYLAGSSLKIACAYVVILELLIAPLILSKHRLLRLFALLQLFCFHIFSWSIVGYIYPVTMFAILAIFLLVHDKFEWPRRPTTLFFLGVVCALQLYPHVFEPNSSLNGRGRILALNMFDARTECQTRFFIRSQNKTVEYAPSFARFGNRIQCDPVLILDHARRTCADQKSSDDFIDLDIDHQTRRISQAGVIEQFHYASVCASPPRISALGAITQ